MGFPNTVGALALLACSWLLLQADGEKSKRLPPSVLKAVAADEEDYCAHSFEKGCHQIFRANLLWRELVITLSGQTAILVENRNREWCGSAGCAVSLFIRQPDKEFVKVLDEIGTMRQIKVLQTVTKGHYDLQKTGREGKKLYRWDGEGYAAEE
ncbi:MAG TPA: hypothetical protein VKY85_06070 [Candidatus Angelobacter sp.]|nr:hypothetical protein [Candidatus Angelobacter sp.]